MNEAFEVNDFLANKRSLWSPNEKEIFAAYKELPDAAIVEISCSLASLLVVLRSLEIAGFFGMYMISTHEIDRGVKIIAYKGKDNPCYDTGKFAIYGGGALAALDDDNHLIFGETRICEKTATIYNLPGYKKLVKVTAGTATLMARLKTDPIPFNCDTFESDVAQLVGRLTEPGNTKPASTAILYPGPFKILILNDGAMIRRGVVAKISKSVAHSLRETDACIILKDELAERAVSPCNFRDAYKNQGAMCLVDAPSIDPQFDLHKTANLSILDEAPIAMKQRLSKMIECDYEYFMLTGSDARDLNGCCPSDGVAAANRLVEAGVLQVARTDPSLDACPVSIYAFAGEILPGDSKPEFIIRRQFRHQIRDYIRNTQQTKQKFLIAILRWSLLLFIGFSLIVMIIRNLEQRNSSGVRFLSFNLVDELGLPFQDGVLILQFHRAARCKFCNDMESLARETINLHFADELREKNIAFRTVNMELPKYDLMRTKFNLFTSTMVLIQLTEGNESRWKIISDAWNFTEKKEEFIQMFRAELKEFLVGIK